MEDMQELGVGVMSSQVELKCKVFEDNSGALSISKLQRFDQVQNTSTPNTGISGII